MYHDTEHIRRIRFPFFVNSAEIRNDYMWFIDNINSGLHCYDLKCEIIKASYKLPYTQLFGKNVYGSLKICRDKVILLPNYGKDILLFHMNSRKFRKIDLELQVGDGIPLYSNTYLLNNFLYIFILAVAKIVIIDLQKEIIEKIIVIPFETNRKSVVLFSNDCAYVKNCESNIVLKFDLKEQLFEKSEIGMDNGKFQLLEGNGTDIYLRGDHGKVLKWNLKNFLTIGQFPVELQYYSVQNNTLIWKSFRKSKIENNTFDKFYDDGEGIWILPSFCCELIHINKKTYKIKKMILEGEEELTIRDKITWGKYYICSDSNRDNLWLYSIKRELFYKINVKELTYEEIELYVSDRFWYDWMSECFIGKAFVPEDRNINISQFIEYVKHCD